MSLNDQGKKIVDLLKIGTQIEKRIPIDFQNGEFFLDGKSIGEGVITSMQKSKPERKFITEKQLLESKERDLETTI